MSTKWERRGYMAMSGFFAPLFSYLSASAIVTREFYSSALLQILAIGHFAALIIWWKRWNA